MNMVERVNMGGLYTGMGMLIVFAVLIILMVVILLMKLFTKQTTETEVNAPAAAPTAVPAPVATAMDTNETIAVISATVAAMSGDDPNKRLRVKSIKDQSGNVIWSK